MRILLIGPYPPPHGGISVHVSQLHARLLAADVPCLVLDPSRAGGKLAFLGALFYRAWQGWTFHIHANGHSAKSWLLTLIGALVARIGGGCLITIHSGMAVAYLSARGWRRSLAALACRQAGRIICVNRAIQQAVVSLDIPAQRTSVVHAWLGLPHHPVAFDPRVAQWIETRGPLFATALFFRPEYGFDLLLDALSQLRETHPNLGCLVMGDGDNLPTASKALAAAGLEEHVLLLGDIDHDTCLTLMSRCNVFLRPTFHDGDSISVREALSVGVPVVASRVGTRPDGVILFEPGDLQDLVAKVRHVLGEKTRLHQPIAGFGETYAPAG